MLCSSVEVHHSVQRRVRGSAAEVLGDHCPEVCQGCRLCYVRLCEAVAQRSWQLPLACSRQRSCLGSAATCTGSSVPCHVGQTARTPVKHWRSAGQECLENRQAMIHCWQRHARKACESTCIGGRVHGGKDPEARVPRDGLQVAALQQGDAAALALHDAGQPLQRLRRRIHSSWVSSLTKVAFAEPQSVLRLVSRNPVSCSSAWNHPCCLQPSSSLNKAACLSFFLSNSMYSRVLRPYHYSFWLSAARCLLPRSVSVLLCNQQKAGYSLLGRAERVSAPTALPTVMESADGPPGAPGVSTGGPHSQAFALSRTPRPSEEGFLNRTAPQSCARLAARG